MIPDSNTFIVSYGSLLSHESRSHSGIDAAVIPVTLTGWSRGWVARYPDEKQTYVGALPDSEAVMNAALLPMEDITPELRERERFYDFTLIDLDQLEIHVEDNKQESIKMALKSKELYICNTIAPYQANAEYTFLQSYVDTCMKGCLEQSADFAREFVRTTSGWENGWENDRCSPIYSRAAPVCENTKVRIDQILDECGVLKYRTGS